MIDCDCPRCGSHNTKAFSVLHQDGARSFRSRKSGWFYFRRSFGAHGSATRGQSQSLASQVAAPPVPLTTQFLQGRGVPLVLILGALIGGVPGFCTALAALIGVAIVSGRGDARVHVQRLRQWASTFRCGRCGTVFAVIATETGRTT